MKGMLAGIVISVATLGAVASASASPLTFTYKGTVSSGIDGGGFFGSAGANLEGQSFELIQTFDPAKDPGHVPSPYYSNSTGEDDYANTRLKIGSSDYFVFARGITGNYSSAGIHTEFTTIGYVDQLGTISRGEYTNLNLAASAPGLTGDDQPAAILFASPIYGGTFSTFQYTLDSSTGSYHERAANADFSLQSLTVASVSAVPLPSSAPMFGAALLGFGIVGFRARRRKAMST